MNIRPDEYNVAEERYRPALTFVESKLKCGVSTPIIILLSTLYSNTTNIPSPKPSKQSADINSKFWRLQNVIKSFQAWKFDKSKKYSPILYLCKTENKSQK